MTNIPMRKITVTRNRGYYGMIRALELFADGKPVGKIKQGQTMEIQIPETAQYLVGKMDWGSTEKFSLQNFDDNDSLEINPWFSLNPFRALGIQTIPISIRSKNSQNI